MVELRDALEWISQDARLLGPHQLFLLVHTIEKMFRGRRRSRLLLDAAAQRPSQSAMRKVAKRLRRGKST